MKPARLFCNFLGPLLVLGLAGSSGCSSEGDETEAQNAANAPGDASTLIGTFQVQVVADEAAASGTTSILGKVAAGPSPANVTWEEGSKRGDCVLEKPHVPFCDPGCVSDVCVADGVCEPYPEPRDAGDVVVTGVQAADGSAEFSLLKVGSAYQAPPAVALAFPPFAEGDTVRFSASGGDFAPFTLEAPGIAPLVATSQGLTLASGEPLSLSWEAASNPAASDIRVDLDISHHGGTKGRIECVTADDGSLDIDAELVAELVALGVAGFPSVIIARRSVGSTTLSAGRVDLVVTSDVELSLEVPGVVSCHGDEDCPSGTCQSDLTCS